ncbi:MAG TPA: lipoyl(octanoyl) transferase LipB [Gammaproteobacteria bacterium]|nr:lipoyl(octanoyl) transferase LipB [Xanthomonadales bacterium]HOP22165.1 lipoyl(octanoyl) transferase LipB [Gammaproteobacteria bacterium]HPI95116.1 lipoyl(octanoyl) transferase LipB [Gammaproteobacteria bacterium]HPQ86874.1 lipoyl(octanoyl) transferase LipB [Gammaproteobacteria bacterium]
MDTVEISTPVKIKHLGFSEYEPVWRAMQEFTDSRDKDTTDEIWTVEHPPVFTQGQAGKAEHILAAGDIPVIQVDRGGQVTYHGPGQIVIYPLIDLKRHKMGIKALVHGIEEAIIQTLSQYDVYAQRRENAPGVYVEGKKVASLGLRVRKGCTFHGLAFNIRMDLEPFSRINPCGFLGLEVVQLSEFVHNVDFLQVQNELVDNLCNILKFKKQ